MQSNRVNFDLDKMKKAINSGVVSFPPGLGRIRQQFLRDDQRVGYDLSVKDYTAVEIVRGLVL